MHNYRQAALCLHGLARDDRQWLLNRLPERHRGALRALLDELESLGIPDDGNPLEFAREPSPRTDDAGTAVLEIEGASPDRIWTALESESDAVVKVLLAARDWSWKPAFFARLRKSYRNIATSDRAPTGRVYAALVKALASRLRAQHADRPASRSWNKKLGGMLWRR